MPYIITTERDLPSAEDHSSLTYRERRAVATLEEARETLYRAWGPFDHPDGRDVNQRVPYVESVRAISESGGTVGPLPDGTVIEVEALWWADLRERAGLDRDGFTLDRQTIDTYNASQEADRAR